MYVVSRMLRGDRYRTLVAMPVNRRLTLRRAWGAAAGAVVAVLIGAIVTNGGVASARTTQLPVNAAISKPPTPPPTHTELPPRSCSAESVYTSAAYTAGVKACFEVENQSPYFNVLLTPEVRVVTGTTPLTFCEVQITWVKAAAVGGPAVLQDGPAQRPGFRCASTAAAGGVWSPGRSSGSGVNPINVDLNSFTGGTFTAEATVLFGANAGPVLSVTASYSATMVPVVVCGPPPC